MALDPSRSSLMATRRQATFDITGQFLDVGRIEISGDTERQLVGIAQHGNAGSESKRDRRNRQQVHNVSPHDP